MSEINNTSVLDKTSTAWPRVDDLVLIVKLYKHIDWDGTESPADKDAMGRIMADPRLWPMYQLIRNHQEDPKYLAKLVRGYIPERAQQRQFATAWRLATEQVEIQLKARDAAKPAAEAAPEPAAAAALAWLDAGYWPVVISPITHPGPNPGKKPLGGNDWGAQRPTPEYLRALYAQHPDAGLGLLLGCEGGVVDLDVDDPVEAAPALNRLFPEGLPLTRRWTSHGTRYHLLFKYDARLAKYGKRIIKGQRDAKTGKILGNPAYLGLELRIGTTHPADQSQIQSVIPPSRKSDGTPRRWDGPAELLDLPESVFADLDKYASRPSATANPPAQERARPAPARTLEPQSSPNGHGADSSQAKPPRTGGILTRLAEIFGPDYNPNNAEPEEESGPDNPNDATYEDTSIPEELRPWTHGKDLDAILSIYLGQTIDTSSEPKLIDPESKLYGLYLAVRSQSGTARVVQKWYKSEVPGNLRAAWWSYWKKRIKYYRSLVSSSSKQGTKPPPSYRIHDRVLCLYSCWIDKDGETHENYDPLCNFDARILESIAITTGPTTTIYYKIRAAKPGITKTITLTASEFTKMDWPVTHLGGDWAIGSDAKAKHQVREAIQLLSGQDGITEYTGYNHTGWLQIEGVDYYLHAGGAISPGPDFDPMDDGFAIDLTSTLPLYKLPDPPTGDQLRAAIDAVLRLRAIGRTGRPNAQGIAAAIAALPWRAVLGPCNFAVVLAGGSGGGKTSLACLALQHFAPEHAYDAVRQAPVTWEATQASIDYLRYHAKDSLLVIDNFIADGTAARAQQTKAAYVYNTQGDQHGRDRMNSDMTPKPSIPPRCGLLSTGEDVAARGSARGRCLTVQITKGPSPDQNSIDLTALTPYQTDAAAGLYAQAMAGYIRSIARQGLPSMTHRLHELITDYREQALKKGVQGHARTPAILADLATGYRLFLEWAESLGVIESAAILAAEHWKWLLTLASAQAEQMEEADEALRWRDLLIAALSGGWAYLASPDGKTPDTHQAECGWKYAEYAGKTLWSQPEGGTKIGWFHEGTIYLNGDIAMAVITSLAKQGNKEFSDAVKRRLAEKGWLQTTKDGAKNRYSAKSPILLEGARQQVWKIDCTQIWPDDGPTWDTAPAATPSDAPAPPKA